MIKRMIRKTNNLKLKHKLIISYILVVMIPVLIVGGGVVTLFPWPGYGQGHRTDQQITYKNQNSNWQYVRVPDGCLQFTY